MAKVCFTSTGPTLDSLIDPRFGRSAFLIFLDEKGNIEESIPNPGTQAFRGAGVISAQEVVKRGVSDLVSGNIGPNAFSLLSSSGIKIFLAPPSMTVEEGFKLWQEGKLSLTSTPSTQAGWPGRGFGRGFGRDRGGGWGRKWF